MHTSKGEYLIEVLITLISIGYITLRYLDHGLEPGNFIFWLLLSTAYTGTEICAVETIFRPRVKNLWTAYLVRGLVAHMGITLCAYFDLEISFPIKVAVYAGILLWIYAMGRADSAHRGVD